MEFSFRFYEIFKTVEANPMLMVMWAAFGVPLVMLVFAFVSRLYRKLSFQKKLNTIIFLSLGVSWILGFIIMITLFFAEVSGIKLLIIWLVIYFSLLLFCIIHSTELSKLTTHLLKEKSNKQKK